ncbi:ACP S-malonyltransferase [Stomatohabitans albus]|uniref:ACP S-malonyltransferase n=1 Tax=Stomatohabitans albus TaxID=3110766 RepID=UPI00300D33E1
MSEQSRRIALVFPGQGSQQPQMAVPWQGHPAYTLWERADDVLKQPVTRLGTEADAAELKQADNCQIALFVQHAMLLEAFAEHGVAITLTAGHSLGEYNALLAAQVLGFDDALQLVAVRARSTMEAAQARPGTMVACLGFDRADVETAARNAGAFLANENAPGQITVSGSKEALNQLKSALADKGGRIVDLDVGAAYHSPHVEAAVPVLGEALDQAAFHDASTGVVANADAKIHTAAHDWPQLLRIQLTSPVLWKESVETMVREGITDTVELGASAPLSGMIKRIARGVRRHMVHRPEDIETVVNALRTDS